jgi:hypothetical protein
MRDIFLSGFPAELNPAGQRCRDRGPRSSLEMTEQERFECDTHFSCYDSDEVAGANEGRRRVFAMHAVVERGWPTRAGSAKPQPDADERRHHPLRR